MGECVNAQKFVYNNSVNQSNGLISFQIIQGRSPNGVTDLMKLSNEQIRVQARNRLLIT